MYAGIDPVTGQRHYLRETFEPGPRAARDAEAARVRLVSEVAERRNPRTSATVDQLLDRYLDQFDGAPNTLTLYRGYVRNHISPFLGRLRVGQVDADILDSFYAEPRRCRGHCASRKEVDHRTPQPHECDERCTQHRCRPLAKGTVRHMHFILSGAFRKAVRWRWVSVSPISQAEPPSASPPNPEPPTPAEAARILNEAWRDPAWGAQLWTAMTTGVRRGELCAIRWPRLELDPARPTVWLRAAIRKDEHGRLVEAELKTHQQRRIALDPETAEVLREHRARCEQDAAALGVELDPEAFVFSPSPDASVVREAGFRHSEVRAARYPARDPDDDPQATALLGDRTIPRWGGCSYGGGTSRPRRRWDHDTPHIHRMGLRGRSACRCRPRSGYAGAAPCRWLR